MNDEGASCLRIHRYPLKRFNFPAVVADVLGVAELDDVHQVYSPPAPGAPDQASAAHLAFYDGFGKLREMYHEFLQCHVLPLFRQDICVQRTPSFRVGFPGGMAVHEFHLDSDYNHQRGTINFWLPVTKAFDTNTMWVESAPCSGDYQPVNLQPGQFLQFDATVLRHGNLYNTTGRTRVSFDFRVIPLKNYRPRGLRTVCAALPLELGAYYMLLTSGGTFTGGDE